jgi:tyrosinase
MMSSCQVTRRRLIATATLGGAVVALPDWLDSLSHAADRPKRSEFSSDTGKKMLELYKKAIIEMRDNEKKIPRYHPHHWYFQGNIHGYPSGDEVTVFDPNQTSDQAEKAKIKAYKEIALGTAAKKGVWKTCSHYGYPTHFLTWHRLYLYFFERIVEKYAGEPFALPYWRYRPDNPESWKLPKTSLAKTIDGKANPLYFAEQNKTFVEKGILTAAEVNASDAVAMKQLLPGNGRDGFSLALEITPHGDVHSAVGTVKGMGVFGFAGRDPIFWMHHANIDRIWESWRRAKPDGTSPLDTVANADADAKENWDKFDKFAFVDANAALAMASVDDAIKAAAKLGTAYDKLDDVPGEPGAPAMMSFAQADPPTTLSAKKPTPQPTQITKEDAPVKVSVAPAVAPPVALGFAAKANTRYELAIDVQAHAQPGAAYQVYIKAAKAPGSQEKVDEPVKTFNLFTHSGHGGDHIAATWRADITKLVQDKRVDPTKPVELTIRARYADPAVPVEVKAVQIRAR